MSMASLLVQRRRGSVVAAAGCGKTELIAESAAGCVGRQLILTHTNAGVDALRRRLRRYQVGSNGAAVDTIAGWCLKYLASYPGYEGGIPSAWPAVYPAMSRLLYRATIQRILVASYTGVFVDEYQDCTPTQHELIKGIAQVLPVRVLGDPLQAVFKFEKDPPDWETEVEGNFPQVGTLSTGWRWRRDGGCRALGEWLEGAREALSSGEEVSLKAPVVRHIEIPSPRRWQEGARRACFEVAEQEGTVAAITKWPNDFQLLGKLTAGRFQCVEPLHANDASNFLASLERVKPQDRPELIMDFVREISVNVSEAFAKVRDVMREDGPDDGPPREVRRAADMMMEVERGGPPVAAAEAIDALTRLTGPKVYRRELAWAAIDSLRDAGEGNFSDLEGMLQRRRRRASQAGRRLARCCTGSTLLLKGMEFDHCIVVDTGEFNVNEVYVALTRGSKSLTVVSARSSIR